MTEAAAVPAYSSYTYEHPNFLVRYPHIKRMHIMAKIIGPTRRWLDYGTGDAEVYRFCREVVGPSERAVLYEPNSNYSTVAFHKLRNAPEAEVVTSRDKITGQFDLITVFEVLEHLPLPERITFFREAAEHLAPGGRILIEVPIEYGPILLLKEFGRRVLKGRESAYGTAELLNAAFLNRIKDAEERYNPHDTRTVIQPHHGFDIKRFARELRALGTIVSEMNSPFPFLPTWSNQCRIFDFRLECEADEVEGRLLAVR